MNPSDNDHPYAKAANVIGRYSQTGRWIALAITTFVLVPVSHATSLAPCALEERMLDKIVQNAGPNDPVSAMEMMALGRFQSVARDTLNAADISVSDLHLRDSSCLRSYALRKLGEIATPGAIEFLRNLKQDDLGSGDTQRIWTESQIALRRSQLTLVYDPRGKINFLENTLSETHDAASDSGVVAWAVGELCDRGALRSLPVIRQAILQRDSSGRGDDQIGFCEMRMKVISRDPNRVAALASVLPGPFSDPRLIRWAIRQLENMRSSDAEDQIEAFVYRVRSSQVKSSDIDSIAQEIEEGRSAGRR